MTTAIPPTGIQDLHHTLDLLYHEGTQDQWDRVILVIGDEGVGKSTLMLTTGILWKHIKDQPVDADGLLDQVVWGGRSEFKQKLTSAEPQSVIPVMDAARVLHNLETQVAEQRDIQKDMLDIRVKGFLFLLGFQDWDDVPKFLKKRRAKNALVIPRRGYVKGYNRDAMDHKYETDDWPDPTFRNHFPTLEGLDIWDQFKDRDEDEKMERIQAGDDPDPDDVYWNMQAKVALRSVKPWSEDEGMTQRGAAKLIDFSASWINDRLDEWDDGHHRDLLGEEELEAIQTVAVEQEAV